MSDLTRLRELASQLPKGLRSDWDCTNHFELQTPGRDFWWLVFSDMECDCDTVEGKRLGLVMDIAEEVSRLYHAGELK